MSAPDLGAYATRATPSAASLAEAVRAGATSAVEVTSAALARIAEVDPLVHALVHIDTAHALERARKLDQRRRRGGRLGPLAGVPFVVKDNMDVRGQTTASGSHAHDGVVAMRNARAVSRVLDAGAVLVGRANMDELAMGASTQSSAFGPTRNPVDLTRSPGGSSGGSAAAVAAGLVPLSLGTDTGGSIREPAAQCGIVGMAPSPGLVPLTGVVPFAPGLDRVGPLAADVAGVAALLEVLSGRTMAGPVPIRVGLVRELSSEANQHGVLCALRRTMDTLTALGITLVTVSIPEARRGLSAYMTITSAVAAPLLERYVRTGQAGEEVTRRWELGRAITAEELAAARLVRARLGRQARAALEQCDVLLSPTIPTTAPPLASVGVDDPMAAPYTDCWTVIANLAGLPALSLPAGLSVDDGLPVAVMLAGAPGSDAALLALAAQLEGRVR